MKQFTQQQAVEMYAALKEIVDTLSPDDFAHWTRTAREALARADAQPVAAPSAKVARDVMADMERPLRIVELSPLDVMEMEEQAGIEATEELDHYTTPLPANGLAYLLGAQIAGEVEAQS